MHTNTQSTTHTITRVQRTWRRNAKYNNDIPQIGIKWLFGEKEDIDDDEANKCRWQMALILLNHSNIPIEQYELRCAIDLLNHRISMEWNIYLFYVGAAPRSCRNVYAVFV